MDSENQVATKITSAFADLRICSFMKMMFFFDEDIVFVFGSYDHLFPVFHFFSHFVTTLSFSPIVVTMLTSKPTGVCLVNRWKKGSAERIEN